MVAPVFISLNKDSTYRYSANTMGFLWTCWIWSREPYTQYTYSLVKLHRMCIEWSTFWRCFPACSFSIVYTGSSFVDNSIFFWGVKHKNDLLGIFNTNCCFRQQIYVDLFWRRWPYRWRSNCIYMSCNYFITVNN